MGFMKLQYNLFKHITEPQVFVLFFMPMIFGGIGLFIWALFDCDHISLLVFGIVIWALFAVFLIVVAFIIALNILKELDDKKWIEKNT